MGAGYAIVDQAMHGQFSLELLLVLAAMKILATASSFLSECRWQIRQRTLLIAPCWAVRLELSSITSLRVLPARLTFVLRNWHAFRGNPGAPHHRRFMVIELSGN